MRFEVLFTSCLFIPMLVSASTCTVGYCKNGGTCVLSRGSANCSCPANVTGATCEQDVDECVVLVSPCKNGGTCSNTMGSYGCRCISGWDGFDCAVNIDDCASSDGFPKCDNGGTCVDRVGTFFCSCISNYTGLTCQHENQCETLKPCHGDAQCRIDLFGRYSCNCSASWTGQNCSIDIDECGVAASSGVPLCHHGATCSNTPGSFSCNCVPGYTGLTCQHENQCETLKPCHGGAQCQIDLFGRYYCSCSAGWTGQNCSIDIDECGVAASSGVPLCHHGATCANTPGSFSCDCVSGFTGQRCESAIDECSSNPCQNGGTCEDYPNRFACFCKPGWTGLLCQQEINERDNRSSQNGGQSSMKRSVVCVVVRCIIFSILLAFCEFVGLISL